MPEIHESDTIADVIVVEPNAHGDQRGRFVETYRRSWFPLGREMTQANRSEKQAGAIVGLHYHLHQACLLYTSQGREDDRVIAGIDLGEHLEERTVDHLQAIGPPGHQDLSLIHI